MIDSLEGTEFDAVDIASLKARLLAYRVAALTNDPGSALVLAEGSESDYQQLDNGTHETTSAVGFIDGEGTQLLTGTLQTGEEFFVYLHVVVEPVAA